MRTIDHLDAIRQRIQAQNLALKEARERRDVTLAAASTFPGVLRTFRSGSLATGFVNHPVDDADGGLVLDRRAYPELGPDGANELPFEIVDDVHDHLPNPLRDVYPKARIEKMKRGLLIAVHEPIDSEQDPTVDVVIALNRRALPGLLLARSRPCSWGPAAKLKRRPCQP